MAAHHIFIAFILSILFGSIINGRSLEPAKVFQSSETSGFIQSNSTSTAIMLASGSPAGILNAGGTTTSFTGSSTMNQDHPTNTSNSAAESLSANCGGGQLGTFVAGQQQIVLHSVGNCTSYVDSNKSVVKNEASEE